MKYDINDMFGFGNETVSLAPEMSSFREVKYITFKNVSLYKLVLKTLLNITPHYSEVPIFVDIESKYK